MTGRYPPGHGARHNGMRIDLAVPTLADTLGRAGLRDGRVRRRVSARSPLRPDQGLPDLRRPHAARRRRAALANERPGRVGRGRGARLAGRSIARERFFLWVHLFEPHAPYGDRVGSPAGRRRATTTRSPRRIAQVGRLIEALGATRASTLVAVAADHGEAFGEHGEISHSVFVYDTTLRVPLVIAGPRRPRAAVVKAAVGLVDLAPTMLGAARASPRSTRTASTWRPALAGQRPAAARALRRVVRAAARFRLEPAAGDPLAAGSSTSPRRSRSCIDLSTRCRRNAQPRRRRRGNERGAAGSGRAHLPGDAGGAEDRRSGSGGAAAGARLRLRQRRGDRRARDRIPRIAAISRRASRRSTSGELAGRRCGARSIRFWRADPANPQAHLRLGYRAARRRAVRGGRRATSARRSPGHMPGADAVSGARRLPGGGAAVRRRGRDAAASRAGRAGQSGGAGQSRHRALGRRPPARRGARRSSGR